MSAYRPWSWVTLGMCPLLIVLLPGPAQADLPPPPDYVESCTREKKEGADELCKLMNASYMDSFGCKDCGMSGCEGAACTESFEACCPEEAAEGWELRCQQWGASAFSVLWCRTRKAGDPPGPVDPGTPDAGPTETDTDAGPTEPGTDTGPAEAYVDYSGKGRFDHISKLRYNACEH